MGELIRVITIHAASEDHPNKAPFEGIMTYFDAPSENPVGGAGGKLVYIPYDVGIKALHTLEGMAVSLRSDLSGHAKKQKVGVIEKAWTGDRLEDGSVPVYISGYLYAVDFPDEVEDLRAEREDLGFSYETKDTTGYTMTDALRPTLYVTDVGAFTGAAILYKEKAAYTRTSFAAESEEIMDQEQLKALLAEMGMNVADLEGMSFADVVDMVRSFAEFRESIAKAGGYASMSMYLSAAADNQAKVDELTEKVAALETALAEAQANLNASFEDKPNLDGYVKVEEYEALKASLESLSKKLDALAPHAEALRAEAEEKAKWDRKSAPQSLMAKFANGDEPTDLAAAIEAIDKLVHLDTATRLAMKMEARAKLGK